VGAIFHTPVPAGECSVLTAKVAPPHATGTVTFTDNFNGTTTTRGTASVSPGGLAVILAPELANGTHLITATFTDATTFSPSSQTRTFVINGGKRE
jgi:hypothetical protein